ncbi:hypothetical protein PC9H_007206 [Pleurotus ostreatus]|uniref:Uncharacterized protein n=1 Tax=Pleurotus ostreatus TaxID=5322 RepID=A0A8H6ZUG1_PLEOS|nr:uncharacterized protein PC9H_007206 [Pleurotus ostreatus]KAF7427988.1 hypothetical protein PC9H_007206 [Pleurotus ostreatus]KAJ8696025.1 hypothetical protein PTI98_005927 [Pleurotus ostreatus]
MCINDNSAALSAHYLSSQLSALWKNADDCVATETKSPVVNLHSASYEIHKYTRSLAQWHFAGKRAQKGDVSKDSLFFYALFEEPKLEFICNHEAALYLTVAEGHCNKVYPSKTNVPGYKSNPKDNVDIKGLKVAFRLPFTRHVLEGYDKVIGNGPGHLIQMTILDLKNPRLVLFADELDYSVKDAASFYLKKYLHFLHFAGHHVLFDLPDFDNDTYRHTIDYSLVSKALTANPGLCKDVDVFGISLFSINEYLKTTWLDVASREFTGRSSSDPLADCIWEVRSNTLSNHYGHFHIRFEPQSIQSLCRTEVVLTLTASEIEFFASSNFELSAIDSFRDWKFAFVLDVIQDKSHEVTLLKLDLGSARYSDHYSTKVTSDAAEFFQQIVRFLRDEYLSLLVQYGYHVIFSPHSGFDEEPDFSDIGEDSEWKIGVDVSGPSHSATVMWGETVRKISLHGFDHMLAISEEAINSLFSSMHTVLNHGFLHTYSARNMTVKFLPIKVKLLSNGNALVIFNIEVGSMTFENGQKKYSFDAWSIAYETRIKMVEQKSITWEQAVVELFGKTYIQKFPNVQTIKHIILDFARAEYVGKQSLMPGMWDNDSRSAVHRLKNILEFMGDYLQVLAKYGHNVIHSVPILPASEAFGLTDATFRVLSKDVVTVANCVYRHTAPVLMVFGMTQGRPLPDTHIPWGSGWVFPQSHGSLCLSKKVFLEGRLLPALAVINTKTTVVPRFPNEGEEEYKVYLTTWDQHRYRKDKACDWTLLEGTADWLEYGWEHRDEWKYEHSGTREANEGFSVLCHTKHQLILPTTYRASSMEIKLNGQSILRVKEIKNDRTKETKATWSAVIVAKTDAAGLHISLRQPVLPVFDYSESVEVWSSFNTDVELKRHLPNVINIDAVLSELRTALEGDWRWAAAALGTYNLASPVFTKNGDLVVQLRQIYDSSTVAIEAAAVSQSDSASISFNKATDNVATSNRALPSNGINGLNGVNGANGRTPAIRLEAPQMERAFSNSTASSGGDSPLPTPGGSDDGNNREIDVASDDERTPLMDEAPIITKPPAGMADMEVGKVSLEADETVAPAIELEPGF